MYKDTYKRIEREYEIKRNEADRNFKELKDNLYNSNPRLKEIDTEISKLGVQTAKLLISSSPEKREEINKDLECKISKLKDEKNAILSKLNIDLTPKYSCDKCKDTGYIKENGTTHMCPCFKQELINESYSKSNLYKLKEESFAKIKH